MRGFHPASSVPRRRRFRRRRTENGRTIVAAVRTFHALRRTPFPPVTSPCGLSRCPHFQPTTNPAFSHDEAPGGLHICSLPTHDEPCRVPLRSPSRPLHICSLSTHDDPCLLAQRCPSRFLYISSLSTHDDLCLLRMTRPYGLSTAAHLSLKGLSLPCGLFTRSGARPLPQ